MKKYLERTNKKLLWGILPFCLVFWTFKIFSKPMSLEEHAKKSLNCVEASDAGCVIGHMTEGEIKKCGYNRQNIQILLDELIAPTWGKLKRSGDAKIQNHSVQSVAYRSYILPNGADYPLTVDSMSDDDSPRIIFSTLLRSTLRAKFCFEHPSERSNEAITLGLADELEKIAPRLKTLGVTGMYIQMPVEGATEYIELSEYISNVRKFAGPAGRSGINNE